ncbi:hypothetical protein Zmor_013717 [Zophobas morio]|uniref:Gustatory receptor n=1 Tax=Zophobas morio TaxID=2755281 RepID=A0AA38IB17_9CUCU|nr:hypothetical protein Zmor_013717 [Zophobas morio]
MKIQPKEKLFPREDSMKIVNTDFATLPSGKNIPEKNNLHKSFSKMLVLAQIFGYLPAQGILGPDFRSLHFTWKSVRVLYAVLTIVGAIFVSVMQMHKIFVKGFDLMEANRFFFNFSGVVGGILFLKLAITWPTLIKDWTSVEVSMLSYGWPAGLNRKLNTLLITFSVMGLVEHLLGQINKLILSLNCNTGVAEGFNYFLSNMSFSHIFSIMDYDVFKGLTLQAINLQLCFIWTFNDLFVMILSTALSYRFSQITARIQSVADAKIDSEIIWKNLREDYNRLCRLCRRVDEEISYIVLMTFASDLFFILVQLFNSLRHLRNDIERIYFYWSFGFLIVRTISLCLFGAQVNDESTKPMLVLNSVSSSVYNLEIQRFIQQIGTSEVAITGKNFFSITRGLILSIAGAIVTYELVLIQFNDALLKSDPEEEGVCPVYV